jgi:hypothetical protein
MQCSWVITENLEIGKMARACNFSGCMKAPTKKITLSGRSVLTREKRDLASIYFCTEHYNKELRPITEKLRNACGKQIKIEKTVKEIGYITH